MKLHIAIGYTCRGLADFDKVYDAHYSRDKTAKCEYEQIEQEKN